MTTTLPDPAGRAARFRPGWFAAAAALLLGAFLLAGLDLARRKSATWDETGHLTAGYSYWFNGDHRMTTNNGILAQRWAALPLWFSPERPRFPDAAEQAAERDNPIELGRDFLFTRGNDPVALLYRGRAMILLLAAGLGLLVLAWSRALFGEAGALASLLLFVGSPPVLAHSALVTTDLAAALALLVATLAWWRLLGGLTPARVLAAGIAAGLLVLTKFSFLVFVAVAGVLALARVLHPDPLATFGRSVRGRGGKVFAVGAGAALVALTAWVVLWAGYGFRFSIPGHAFDWEGLGPGTLAYRGTALLRRLHLFPEPFIFDLAGLRYLNVGRGTYFHGTYSLEGFRLFFPASFILKSTPAFLVLGASGVVAVFAARTPAGRALAWRALPLLVLAAVYFGSAVASKLNLGVRHLLPVYAPLCILAGASCTLRPRRLRWLACGVALPAAAVSAVQAHPDELAYTNFLGGGTAQGWRWFVGSAYDWGGELPDVARHAGAGPEAGAPSYLLYSGTADPAAYGVPAVQVDGFFRPTQDFTRSLHGGTYYVCATNLMTGTPEAFGPWTAAFEQRYQYLRGQTATDPGDPDFIARNRLVVARLCSFLRQRTPDGRLGQAVFVFHLTDADLQRVVSGPPAELFADSPVRGWRANPP